MISQVYVLYKREVLKLLRSRYMWVMLVAQPVMWLVFFGNSLAGMPRGFLAQYFGVENYLSYMLPGMVSILMMTTGMFSSMSLVVDKRFGYLKRVLVTPTPKSAVFLAKALGAATRGFAAVPVLLALGALLGAGYKIHWQALAAWVISLFAGGMGFAALFTAFTANASDVHAPGVVNNLISMPLMFTSTALFPKQFFPTWLKAVSEVNPLTYLTEVGRDALVYGVAPNPVHVVAVVLFGLSASVLATLVVETGLTAD
ncbi:MAG: ABC transporter permease [Pyrobaculum sp.]